MSRSTRRYSGGSAHHTLQRHRPGQSGENYHHFIVRVVITLKYGINLKLQESKLTRCVEGYLPQIINLYREGKGKGLKVTGKDSLEFCSVTRGMTLPTPPQNHSIVNTEIEISYWNGILNFLFWMPQANPDTSLLPKKLLLGDETLQWEKKQTQKSLRCNMIFVSSHSVRLINSPIFKNTLLFENMYLIGNTK